MADIHFASEILKLTSHMIEWNKRLSQDLTRSKCTKV